MDVDMEPNVGTVKARVRSALKRGDAFVESIRDDPSLAYEATKLQEAFDAVRNHLKGLGSTPSLADLQTLINKVAYAQAILVRLIGGRITIH